MKKIVLTGAMFLGAFSMVFAQQAIGFKAENAKHTVIESTSLRASITENTASKVGASSATVIWSEDFANGIPSSWTFGGYYTNSSTGATVALPDAAQSPVVNGWEYRGPSTTPDTSVGTQGAYGSNRKIDSPTKANGWIIFDSDYLDNAGTPGNFGFGNAPTPHVGTLSTDVIDFTGYPDIQIEMSSHIRTFFGQSLVAFSSDGGATFPDTVELHSDLDVNEANEADGTVRFKISDYVGGSANAVIQFIFEGATEGNTNGTGYYYWQVDDISISEVPENDFELANTDFFFDNNDVINTHHGFEIRDYYGKMPLNQIDSINLGFNIYNYGTNDRTDARFAVNCDLNGSPVYSNTEAVSFMLPSDTSVWEYKFGAYMPTGMGVFTANYTLEGDSTDASPSNNTSSINFEITDTVMDPFNPNTNKYDVVGTGMFDSGDDGLILGNVISIIEADELTSVSVRLNKGWNNADYNSVPGGIIKIAVIDTAGLGAGALATTAASYLMQSGNYTVTSADTAAGFATIPIPATYIGSAQNRTLNPGSYVLCAILQSNGAVNNIIIRDDIEFLRRGWESLIYIPGDKWYTNGNALGISANFGTWGTSIEENSFASQLVAFPNPTNGDVQLSFSLSSKANTSIIVRDLTGKEVMNINKGVLSVGRHFEKIQLNDFSNGVYFYELNTNGESTYGKVVLSK